MKRRPGEVRDAIVEVLSARSGGASLGDIQTGVSEKLGPVSSSSIRSYLQLNTPRLFTKMDRAKYSLNLYDDPASAKKESRAATNSALNTFEYEKTILINADCCDWLSSCDRSSIHAVVTDPPYGLIEYSSEQQEKLRNGKGGIWRIPPSFDGNKRSPLPRFTVLTATDLKALDDFFFKWARLLSPALVPGANVVVASNPLLSHVVSNALARAGLERRGEIVRLVMTMRGGDRPKAAHEEFPEISVMPRSMWEPWLVFRKPLEGRVQDNLRKWGTGGFRRPSTDKPFGDVILSSPTRTSERAIASHPSLKPQAFLRQLVRGVLPMGQGIILDPFAGSGSTLAAASVIGYQCVGIEKDPLYFELGSKAIPNLAKLKVSTD